MIADQTDATEIVAGLPKGKQNRFTCVGCGVKFDSGEQQRAHFKTEWHLYNLKRRVCNLEPIDVQSFKTIQDAAPAQVKPNETTADRESPPTESASSSKPIAESDDDWEDVGEDDLIDEDYDEEEAAEMLARVIKSDTCLFCDKKSPDMKTNITHMDRVHGFFIPEEQYLIDLEGLMEYLGFKVGAGATCLWCHKQFTTVHGVRLHMIYKNHCKILYDQEKAIDEFKEFYDYSTQEHIPMKPLNQLAIPKKRSEARAEHDRTVAKAKLNDGDSKQLVAKKNLAMIAGSYQAKNIKKFDAYRAKILLRTGMANNYTMRGRLRQQNPI